jgi:hypothetical protein
MFVNIDYDTWVRVITRRLNWIESTNGNPPNFDDRELVDSYWWIRSTDDTVLTRSSHSHQSIIFDINTHLFC